MTNAPPSSRRCQPALRGFSSLLSVLLLPVFVACGGGAEVPGSDGAGVGGSGSGGDTGTGTGGIPIDVGTGGKGGKPNDPKDPVCGNEILEPGEACDDGNTKDGDGCSKDCKEIDPDYFCSEPGKPCDRVVTCGNGVIEGDEVCDDGNTKDGDGCSKNCRKVEEGYECIKPNQPCVLKPVCGNGVRERGEQCDDGQNPPESGDGCSDKCQLEPGYFCPPGQPCIQMVCGDGVRTPDEACDDGDNIPNDGCTNCQIDDGWRCSSSGCRPICGDGKIVGNEECDDGQNPPQSGDGCSSACRVEPFYSCSGEPSTCVSTIVCGDGELGPGEMCDPAIPGQEACFATGPNACRGYDTGLVDPPVCGNGVIELNEECDGDGGSGGCINCEIQDGFACPKADYCFRLPICGDGILQAGEECDPGAASSPGCMDCKIQDNYYCSGEPSECVQSICGDGFRAPDEECDDGPGTVQSPGTPEDGDGCSAHCKVELGWVCPPGFPRCLPKCGDGRVVGDEECDTDNTDACLNCRLRPGWTCDAQGNCTETECGNGDQEPGEGCDDGNQVAGDGCGPTCQLEPTITRNLPDYTPVVAVTCGDGIKTGDEECDDGNTTSGDGCSSACQIEHGWYCEDTLEYPDEILFRITYRDFKFRAEPGGHPHMKASDQTIPQATADRGIVGDPCTVDNQATCGRLDQDGKPTYDTARDHPSVDNDNDSENAPWHAELFRLWYRDSNPTDLEGLNGVIQMCPNPPAGSTCTGTPIFDTLPLTRVGSTTAYRYDSNRFYPLGYNGDDDYPERGWGYTPKTPSNNYGDPQRNFHFTSELRYFFQYRGGERLTFYGDDDVWVFVNGRLAVDIGGIHSQLWGQVVLGDEDGSCTKHGKDDVTSENNLPNPTNCYSDDERADSIDGRFAIEKGRVYEIVVFQAERHPIYSNYRLTLDGFLAPRSTCHTDCGDGVTAGNEVCDQGADMPASGYGVCKSDCTFEFCGDGIKNGDEACDDGVNANVYGTGCAPGCVLPGFCGDGVVQSAFEVCDDGVNDGSYGGCMPGCQQLAPYCGDGDVDEDHEDCDTPGQFTTYATQEGACNYDCSWAGFCGDGERNGPEICDDGALNGTGQSNCNTQCEFDPYCGDGVKTSNEECDYGPFAYNGPPESAPYGGCTNQCLLGPHCGDEIVQSSEGEECDDGDANKDNLYDGCTKECILGPRCGDAILQAGHGEACDNGFNEDTYAYPGAVDACGPGCKAVPFCGDGVVQSAYELCDNGALNSDTAYDGCTTTCEWGPYCGDGVTNGSEECDDGPDNVAYSPDGTGCSYDCKKNVPYCGDGVRNGPEQCDLGTGANTGEYGGCNADCTRAPHCGDKKVQRDEGEECDDGPAGSLTCTQTCQLRSVVR